MVYSSSVISDDIVDYFVDYFVDAVDENILAAPYVGGLVQVCTYIPILNI